MAKARVRVPARAVLVPAAIAFALYLAHMAVFRGWIVDERGSLRRHVKLYFGQGAVSLDTPIGPDDELHIVAAISGG